MKFKVRLEREIEAPTPEDACIKLINDLFDALLENRLKAHLKECFHYDEIVQ